MRYAHNVHTTHVVFSNGAATWNKIHTLLLTTHSGQLVLRFKILAHKVHVVLSDMICLHFRREESKWWGALKKLMADEQREILPVRTCCDVNPRRLS